MAGNQARQKQNQNMTSAPINKIMQAAQLKADKIMAAVSVEKLIESLRILSGKFDEESETSSILILNHLEGRMNETDFLALCETL